MKRLFDLCLSISLLILLSLPMLLIACLIYWRLGLPVLFRQQRPGLNAKAFYIYKFRSMTDTCDPSGNLLSDAERLPRFGAFLRRFSLDELPQLFNVVRGDLSLVGPRPLLMEYLPLYSPEQSRRHEVLPGITGWAQVNGRNAVAWSQKFAYDVWYVEHQSFWLDMKIMWMTLSRVLKSDGVSQNGHVTMEKFRGNYP